MKGVIANAPSKKAPSKKNSSKKVSSKNKILSTVPIAPALPTMPGKPALRRTVPPPGAGDEAENSRHEMLQNFVHFARYCYRVAPEVKADAYLAHGIEAMPAADIIAQAVGGRVYCDVIDSPSFRERGGTYDWHPTDHVLLEHAFDGYLRNAEGLSTVSWALARELERYGRPVTVIPNYRCAEEFHPSTELRARCGLGPDDILLLASSTIYSGFEAVIESLKFLPDNVHLATLGMIVGHARDRIHAYPAELGVASRVHFLDVVPYERLLAVASGANLGLIALNPAVFNHWVALPNRVFDSIAAHLPLVTLDMPGTASIVTERQIGVVVSRNEAHCWAEAIKVALSREQEMRPRVRQAAKELIWEAVEDQLRAAYGRPASLTIVSYQNLVGHQRTLRMVNTLIKGGTAVTICCPYHPERSPDEIPGLRFVFTPDPVYERSAASSSRLIRDPPKTGPERRLVIIASGGSSGSHLLARILSGYPSLRAAPKLGVFHDRGLLKAETYRPALLKSLLGAGEAWDRQLSNGQQQELIPKTILMNRSFYGWDDPEDLLSLLDNTASLPDLVDAVHLRLQQRKGWTSDTVLIEHTPASSLWLDELAEIFPNLRIIHLVRDMRDAVASMAERRALRPELGGVSLLENVEIAVDQWVAFNAAALTMEKDPRYLRISYEDLVTATETTVSSVVTHIFAGSNTPVPAPHPLSPEELGFNAQSGRQSSAHDFVSALSIGCHWEILAPSTISVMFNREVQLYGRDQSIRASDMQTKFGYPVDNRFTEDLYNSLAIEQHRTETNDDASKIKPVEAQNPEDEREKVGAEPLRRWQQQIADFRRKAALYDVLEPQLGALRYKAEQHDMLQSELPQLRFKAEEWDKYPIAELLRKSEQYDVIEHELPALRHKAEAYDRLEPDLPTLRYRAEQFEQLGIPRLLRKVEQYDALESNLPAIRYKAARYDALESELPALRFKAERYDALEPQLPILHHKAAQFDAMDPGLRRKAELYDGFQSQLSALRCKAEQFDTIDLALRHKTELCDALELELPKLRRKAEKLEEFERQIEVLRQKAKLYGSLDVEIPEIRHKADCYDAFIAGVASIEFPE